MGLTTGGAVTDRINTLVAAQGFIRAKEPFSFDLQPDQNGDRIFRVELSLSNVGGYIGMAQAEIHQCEIWIARAVKRDAHGAVRQLQADMELIESALIADYAAFDYNVEKTGADVRLPESSDTAFVVACLSAGVDFDRAL